MGLFDIFTAAPAKRAARQNTQAIDQNLASGSNALTTGANAAGALLGVNNGSNATAQLGFGYDRGREAVQGQYGQTQGFLGQIGGLYEPLAQSGQQALSARDDALGLNGADGYGRAKSAFQNSLGYGAGLDAGLDAVMRTAAARGNLGGGNTSADLYRFAADYQNRQAGSYLDRLTGASDNLGRGIAGQAAGLGLQANASQSQGGALGAMDQRYGEGLSGLYGQGASAQLGLGQGLATLGNVATQQRIGNNNALSQAKMQASGNLLNLGMNLFSGGNLSALSGLFGGGGSGGGSVVADRSTGWI